MPPLDPSLEALEQASNAWRVACTEMHARINHFFVDKPVESFQKKTDALIQKNHLAQPTDVTYAAYGFRAGNRKITGTAFRNLGNKALDHVSYNLPLLAVELFPAFSAWEAQDRALSKRAVLSQQVLWPAMLSSKDSPTLRNVMPEALVQRLPDLRVLPRTAPEGPPPGSPWIRQKEYSNFLNVVHDFVAEEFLD